ncbi:MAG TPA: bifunctional aspartate transaminase/aspartate 4-decarboxylase [Verrucomicrobiae bacterium]|jgi:aspartate 4-decarboxylase|nr:bifunctional aspartate transaminase/aspartate 4-decarboxylase [Verrucomicrobiae bacterium]
MESNFETLQQYGQLSPFEIKDRLITLADTAARKSASAMLNAGRGNPNWVATAPREAFFALGYFALTESKRVLDLPGVGGMPPKTGCAARLDAWCQKNSTLPGTAFLRAMVLFTVNRFSFEADAFVHELTDSIIGDNYPVPDRSLVHNEQITHAYLMWAMCGDQPPPGKFDLYPVEGGTAAMCYVFKSLKANRLLRPGDTVALGTPIFTPYLEMPHLEDYGLNIVTINATQENRFQFSEAELQKLEDPKVKIFFLVNPGNPSSMAVSPEVISMLVDLVRSKRPDLMILTDDVYGTFVKDFRSLMADLPHNTIGVYSYSKYWGCTGWRLGVIAVHEDNVFDKMIGNLPEADRMALNARYGTITLEPDKLKFIDRIVADSRDVALNHTAGLSLPQQVMMTIFSIAELMDAHKRYQSEVLQIVKRRTHSLIEGLGIEVSPNPMFSFYYGIIDFEFWIKKYVGPEVMEFIKQHYHPLDIVFRLAEDHSIVLLNGGGFAAPNWSARVSFANLPDQVYADIGRALRSVARSYVEAYRFADKNGTPSNRLGRGNQEDKSKIVTQSSHESSLST